MSVPKPEYEVAPEQEVSVTPKSGNKAPPKPMKYSEHNAHALSFSMSAVNAYMDFGG